jgi:hypothetical protein
MILIFGGMIGNYSQAKDLYSIELAEKQTNYRPPSAEREFEDLY